MDRALGIDTSLTDRSWDSRRRHPCQPTPFEALEAVAARLAPDAHVADFGCGTGRAVFYLAHYARCRVTGVELDRRHFDAAEENLRRCARKEPETAARIRLVHGPAQEVSLAELPFGAPDACYFFNPFPAAVLRGVLKRIDEAQTRPIRLFCYYPDDEWVELLISEGWTLEESVDLRGALGKDARERVDVFARIVL